MTNEPVETPGEALERNLLRIRTEGVDAATEAAIQLLRDVKAPAQARATAINAVFRVSGLLERGQDEDEADPSKMTHSQLERAIRRLRKDADRLAEGGEKTGASNVFK